MNALVEKGFAAALQAAIDGAELTAKACPATSSDPRPTDRPTVIVEATVSHEVGSLYDGRLTITVSTPVKIAPFDAASHSALVELAHSTLAWKDGDPDAAAKTAALDAALAAADSGFETRGFFFMGSEDRRDEEWLQTELSATWGLELTT